jgi:hypothetical protein
VWTLRFEDGCAGDTGAVTAANLIITPWGRDREVTDLIDSGPGTLRDRLNDALPGDVIRFPFGGTVARPSAVQLSRRSTEMNRRDIAERHCTGRRKSRLVGQLQASPPGVTKA